MCLTAAALLLMPSLSLLQDSESDGSGDSEIDLDDDDDDDDDDSDGTGMVQGMPGQRGRPQPAQQDADDSDF